MAFKGGITNSELDERRREADERAWADLVRRYSRYVHAINSQAFNLSDEHQAQVFNEVFTRAHARFDVFADDLCWQSWIASQTRELATDCFGADDEGRDPTDLPPSHVLDQRIARIDEAWKVRQMLELVGRGCREVLDRFFARDESYVTISAALDLPVGTIAERISSCLAKLEIEVEIEDGREQGSHYDDFELGQLIGVLRPAPPYWSEAARRRAGVPVY
ncbi:MAG: RNA polymerase sigma factor [Solirubrobacterales bacterium]